MGEVYRATDTSLDREEPLGIEPCSCISPIVSPDGTRVAVHVLEPNLAGVDIWIWSLAQCTLTRLTNEAAPAAPGRSRVWLS
jgi:Tol biopolymer transport system component